MSLNLSCTQTLSSHQGSVLVVKYNSEGSYCISGSQDKTLKLWNPSKGTLVHTFAGHGYEIQDLVCSTDNNKIFSVADKQIFGWDVSTGENTRRITTNTHTQPITCITMNRDGNIIVTGSSDRTVKIWDLRSRNDRPVQVMQDADDTITGIIIHETSPPVQSNNNNVNTHQHHQHGPNCNHSSHSNEPEKNVGETQIITSSIDGGIRIYDVRNGTLSIDTEEFPVASISMTRDKRCLIATSNDSQIRLIDRAGEYDVLKTYKDYENKTYKMNAVSNFDDRFIISASESDHQIYIWDITTSNIVQKVAGHQEIITHVNAHPSTNQFISSSKDGTIRVWS